MRSRFVKVQVGRDGRQLVRDSTDVELAGRHFFRADYEQPAPGGALSESFVCTKLNGYFLGWTFVASSPEELDQFVSSLQGVSFRESESSSKSATGTAGEHTETGGVIKGIISSTPGTAKSDPSRPLRARVSEGVAKSLLIKRVAPSYPDEARKKGIQGEVAMKVLIDTSGTVKDVELVSGLAELAPAAMEAVRKWMYKPYLLDGQPVNMETKVTIAFEWSGQ